MRQSRTLGQRQVRVLLRGWYGRGNFGDDLIALCLATALHNLDASAVIVPTMEGSFCKELAELTFVEPVLVPDNSSKLKKAVVLTRCLHQADVLALGGGGQIDLSLGRGGLLSLSRLVRLAKSFGKRIWLLHVGVDGDLNDECIPLLRQVLGLSDVVSVRDPRSQVLLLKACEGHLKKSILLGYDPGVYAIAGRAACGTLPPLNTPGGGPRTTVGVALAGEGPVSFRLAELLAEVLTRAAQYRPMKVILFIFRASSDTVPAETVLSRIQAVNCSGDLGCSCVSYDGRIEWFVNAFRQCNLIVAHRLHATILAFLLGIPAITVSKATHSLGVASELYDRRYVFTDRDVVGNPEPFREILFSEIVSPRALLIPKLSLRTAYGRFCEVMEQVRLELKRMPRT